MQVLWCVSRVGKSTAVVSLTQNLHFVREGDQVSVGVSKTGTAASPISLVLQVDMHSFSVYYPCTAVVLFTHSLHYMREEDLGPNSLTFLFLEFSYSKDFS